MVLLNRKDVGQSRRGVHSSPCLKFHLGSWIAQTRAQGCISVRSKVDFFVELRTGSGFQLASCRNHHHTETVQFPPRRENPYNSNHAAIMGPSSCCHTLAITFVTYRTHNFAVISKDSLMWTHQCTRLHYSFRERRSTPVQRQC